MSDREASPVTESVASGESAERAVPIGNRPAQDARQVDAPTQIDADWKGGDDATDFLGLDLEVAPASTAPAFAPNGTSSNASAPEAQAPAGDNAASSSWLMSLDERNAGLAGIEPAVAESVAVDSEQLAEPEQPEEEATEALAPATGAALDASWSDAEFPRRQRKKRVVLVAAGLLTVAALAAYQLRDQWMPAPEKQLVALTPPAAKPHDAHTARDTSSKSDASNKNGRTPIVANGETTPIANHSIDTTPATDSHTDTVAPSSADTTATTSTSATEIATKSSDGSTVADDLDAPSNASRPAADRIESWLIAQRGPEIPGSDLGMSPHARLPFTSSALDQAASSIASGSSDREPNFGMSRSPLTSPGAPNGAVEGSPQVVLRAHGYDRAGKVSSGGLRHATSEDLAGVWEGSVIPMESIGGPSRLLTPGVGRVRILIARGEIFEGRLYAVGQGKVWIDTGLGRLALLSEQVQRIEHLASPSGTPGLGAPGSQELAGLPRVRVRTPGGTFYGKVLARDDATVTLITDQGARVMLESRDVESAPTGVKSVLVKPASTKR
jgi:hypothetical protein